MSVRIHAIAKQTNKTSKEVIAILAERGYEIKSASSTLDNITAQSLIDELSKDIDGAISDSAEQNNLNEEPQKEIVSSDDNNVPFVKSKQDLDKERLEREKNRTARI